MARRYRRTTIGKNPIQHAQTFVSSVGGGTAPASMQVLITEAGARSTTGAGFNTSGGRDSDNENNVGDVVKYVNLFMQAAPRDAEGVNADKLGWLEWAFVCVKESETAVPITNLGTLTLGTVCTNMFRNECIWTGAMPVGSAQPNYLEAKIKIPKSKQKLHVGDEWRFITYFRDAQVTSTSTDNIRLIKSYMYKGYQ